MEKDTIKFYVDLFGIDKIIIITDNLKDYKNGEGKKLFIDYDKEIMHSISAAGETTSFKGSNLFEIETFQFSEIQFISCRGNAEELKLITDKLKDDGLITEDERKETIKFFQDSFAFAHGYDAIDKLSPDQPKNADGEYLTPKDVYSINSGARHPLPYNLNK